MHADDHDQARRGFLHAAVTAMLLALSGALTFLLAGFSRARSPAARPAWIVLAPLTSLPAATYKPLRVRMPARQGWFATEIEVVVYARREGDAVSVLSSTCTHLGCAVRWHQPTGEFHCPCHGGVYAADGSVTAGPPPRPLNRIATRTTGGTVEIRIG